MNKNKITQLSLLNYFYIIITLLWLPLQKTFLHVDGKARTLFFLTIIVIVTNLSYKNFRRITFSKPAVIWFIWCFYVIINAIIQGYTVNLPIEYYIVLKILSPYTIMVVSAYEYTKNENLFLKSMLITFVTYSIIGFYFMDNYYIAMQEGKSADNTLGNLLALNTVFIAYFAALLCNNKTISTQIFYILFAFTSIIITLSATRKAFGAVIIIYVFYLFSQIKPTLNNIIKCFFIFITLYIGINYIINNTFIGERFTNIEESAEVVVNTNNPFLKMMGDRAYFYVTGWSIFLDNPFMGIGLSNFGAYTNTGISIHTEYIVQLCECGIVGTLIYIFFYISLFTSTKKIYSQLPQDRATGIIMRGVIFAILFISMTAWTYDFPFYFAVLGTVIGFSKKNLTNCL